jgi:3-hexulose-6-phosphate synthase
MADLIAAPDLAGRAQQLDELAVDAICVHSASDVQAEGGNPLAELATLCRLKTRAKVAVAGGVNPTMAAELLIFNPEIVVVGGYITGASGHRAAAQEIVDALAGGRNRLAT